MRRSSEASLSTEREQKTWQGTTAGKSPSISGFCNHFNGHDEGMAERGSFGIPSKGFQLLPCNPLISLCIKPLASR